MWTACAFFWAIVAAEAVPGDGGDQENDRARKEQGKDEEPALHAVASLRSSRRRRFASP